MDNINMKLTHKNVEYNYNEWTTYSGQLASGFTCTDKKLLKHTNITQLASLGRLSMLEQIDYYLDNEDKLIELKRLDTLANAEFYAKLNYKGD